MDTIARSIVKSLTWRSVSTFVLGAIVYFLTGNIIFAVGIGAIDFITKLIIYIVHEQVWTHIKWGKQEKVTNEEYKGQEFRKTNKQG